MSYIIFFVEEKFVETLHLHGVPFKNLMSEFEQSIKFDDFFSKSENSISKNSTLGIKIVRM